MVEYLLSHGADPNAQLYCGTSPLHQCASEGQEEIARCLLEHGAKIDVEEEYGITPLFTAAQYGHIGCLQLILSAVKERGW